MKVLGTVATLVLSVLATAGVGQVRDRARPASPPGGEEYAALARGWSALAQGRAETAIAAADELLARSPWSHQAIALKIEALAVVDPMRALDAYESWLGLRTTEDAGLLEPIARTVLLAVARGTDPGLRREAARLLERAHVAVPALPGGEAGKDRVEQLVEDAARAAKGDAAAVARLQGAVAAPDIPDKTPIAQALETAGPAGVPILVTMLNGPAGPGRAAAAAALGRMHADQARPALQQALKDPDPFVRSSAAVALFRLGDQQGQDFVNRMLDSEVPDLRLMAAEAWDGQPGPWVSAIAPLLDNPDGLTRLQAARVIAPVDPEAARRVFQEALRDPNPVIRAEAARLADTNLSSQPAAGDVTRLRALLRDADATVRLQAAGALLALVRAGR